jgi:hypothetical protein
MIMIRSLQRDENDHDRGLDVGDKPAMTPFWNPDKNPEIIHYGEHHYQPCHHHHNRHHAGGAHEIQPSDEASVLCPSYFLESVLVSPYPVEPG